MTSKTKEEMFEEYLNEYCGIKYDKTEDQLNSMFNSFLAGLAACEAENEKLKRALEVAVSTLNLIDLDYEEFSGEARDILEKIKKILE